MLASTRKKASHRLPVPTEQLGLQLVDGYLSQASAASSRPYVPLTGK